MDRTTEFDINGTKVLVDTLPKPTRDMVAMFDRMREDLSEISYQQNILVIAISSLNASIINDAQTYLTELAGENTVEDEESSTDVTDEA